MPKNVSLYIVCVSRGVNTQVVLNQ